MRSFSSGVLAFLLLTFVLGCSSEPSREAPPPLQKKVELKASEPSITKPLGLESK